jgi:hypothetical protein
MKVQVQLTNTARLLISEKARVISPFFLTAIRNLNFSNVRLVVLILKPMRIFFVSLFLLMSQLAHSQHMGAFIDERLNHFFVFEKNEVQKAEFIPIANFEVGFDYVAYIRNNNRLAIFYKGEATEINAVSPRYFAKDELLAYFIDEQLWVLDDGRIKFLEPWAVKNFAIGDNILCFTNNFDQFRVYYKDSVQTLELWPPRRVVAGDNLIAYTDNNEIFKVFYEGERYTIDDIPPQGFAASKDIVAYVDNYGDFKAWYKNKVYELQYQRPTRGYHVGEQMVAFLNDMNQFVVFYDGEIYELLNYMPSYFAINENVLVYTDANGFLFSFYKGKVDRLATYTPNNIRIDNDIVVFQDLDGYLVGAYKGKRTRFSQQIAIDFQLYNHTIVYRIDRFRWRIFYDGNTYSYN